MADEKQTEAQEPGVEQQLEAETGHDVVKTGGRPPTFVETDTPVGKPELHDTYVADIAGNITIVKTQVGIKYKPGDPLGPSGSRVATEAQIAAYQASKGK